MDGQQETIPINPDPDPDHGYLPALDRRYRSSTQIRLGNALPVTAFLAHGGKESLNVLLGPFFLVKAGSEVMGPSFGTFCSTTGDQYHMEPTRASRLQA